MIQMNAIIEIQVDPLHDVRLKRGRQGDIDIDQVEVTHLLRHMPDVIPPALEIDFQEAIRTFKPSAFPMVPIAQPWERKEADHLVRFGIQIRLVFVAQGPVILLGNYPNFSHFSCSRHISTISCTGAREGSSTLVSSNFLTSSFSRALYQKLRAK